MRLDFSKSDQLPALIVDRYVDILVCQFLSTGAEHHKQSLAASRAELTVFRLGQIRKIDSDLFEIRKRSVSRAD